MSNALIDEEKKLIAEEKEILGEIKKEEEKLSHVMRHAWIATLSISIVAAIAIMIGAYAYGAHKTVYVEKAEISAPRTDISPVNSGVLNDVYVAVGDTVAPNTTVAKVGNELIKTKQSGIVVVASSEIGKLFNHGESVVSLIDGDNLRVEGRVQEDSGLSDIHVGAIATFTVDAFGSKKFTGIVDEVSPVSREGDVVFSISDKREKKEFTVKVRYDIGAYPDLKPGMSAKLWISK